MSSTSTSTVQQALQAAVSRTTQVIRIADKALALEALVSGNNVPLEAYFPDVGPDVFREAEELKVKARGQTAGQVQKTFADYQELNIAIVQALSPLFPAGVDVEAAVSMLLTSSAQTKTNGVAAKYKLETYDTPNGRGVSFVQPEGTSLLQIAGEINAESQSRFSRDTIYEGSLLEDEEMKTVSQKEVVHDFIPVVKDSNYKTRNEQTEFLGEKGMFFPDRPEITVATGLFRLENGFPAENSDVGTSQDKGCLLQGQVVRARVGALVSCVVGVDADRYDDDCAYVSVSAAGLPNHKS